MQLYKMIAGNTYITIYNSYLQNDDKGSSNTCYKCYVVDNAFYKKNEKQTNVSLATIDKDTFIAKVSDDTNYVEEHRFLELAKNGDIFNVFTAKTGDVIIKGRIEEEIPLGHNVISYLESIGYENIKDYSFVAKSVSDNRNNMVKEISHIEWRG